MRVFDMYLTTFYTARGIHFHLVLATDLNLNFIFLGFFVVFGLLLHIVLNFSLKLCTA